MYYLIRIPSQIPLYGDIKEAKAYLLSFANRCQGKGGVLLDYSLSPQVFRSLVMLPLKRDALPWKEKTCFIEQLDSKEDLLNAYAFLSEGFEDTGKGYELCGTYEAFHRSDCFCLLGKVNKFNELPSFREILDSKKKGCSTYKKTLSRHYLPTVFALA
jgi:hypothetical protein